jgi:hypothetical protein
LVTSVCGAQVTDASRLPGHFLARQAVSIKTVRARCLDLGDDTYANNVPPVKDCIAGAPTSVGTASGSRWYSALFGRHWLFPDSAHANADTVAELEIVLFVADGSRRAHGDTLLTPVWHYRFEPEILRSVSPGVVAVGGGRTLVSIDECLNGTGGCSQSFFLYRKDDSRVVRLSFLDSLKRRFPDAINHGYHVDIRTMHASAAVYSAGDANCCPSRIAQMRLRLRNAALEIVDVKLSAP